MAKRSKKIIESPDSDNIFPAFNPYDLDSMNIPPKMLPSFSNNDIDFGTFQLAIELILRGVTPEKYTALHELCKKIMPLIEEDKIGEKNNLKPQKHVAKKHVASAPCSLLLRIQMKGVTKPPMWRDVEVPATMTFEDLHNIIQIVCSFENYHLWQFNKNAYMDNLVIGIPMETNDDFGIDDVTDDASETPLSAYLANVGDKLEYVYDFGDDWTFTITVKKVLEKELQHPVCVAHKCDMNPMEDSGGVWSYLDMRDIFNNWSNMSKKAKDEAAERLGYDDPKYLFEILDEMAFDLTLVNEELQDFNS